MMTDIAHTLRRGPRAGILSVSGSVVDPAGCRSTRRSVMKDKHLPLLDSGHPCIQDVPKAFDDRHTTILGHVSASLPD
jgi:hypothetical protein